MHFISCKNVVKREMRKIVFLGGGCRSSGSNSRPPDSMQKLKGKRVTEPCPLYS